MSRRWRLREHLTGDRGTVTAEFAIMLPAVLVVLGVIVGGVLLTAHHIVLVSAASEVARLEARGDTAAAGERLAVLQPPSTAVREDRGRLHCVTLRAAPSVGLLSRLGVSATACAARADIAGAPQ